MAKFDDLPPELLAKIVYHFIEVTLDGKTRGLSPAILKDLTWVNHRWHDIVEDIRWKSLIATPTLGFLPQNGTVMDWSAPTPSFSEKIKEDIESDKVYDVVSFSYGPTPSFHYLMTPLFIPPFIWQQHMAWLLTPALTKTKAIHLSFGFGPNPSPRTSPVPVCTSELKVLSWNSPHVGIRGNLPEEDGFPWGTLRLDFPWHQLTHVELKCPLSFDDTRFILHAGSGTLKLARFAGLKSDAVLQQANLPVWTQPRFSMENLTSLEIHSDIDLNDLLSTMMLDKLKQYTIRIPGIPDLTYRTIYHPWNMLTEVSIDRRLSVTDAYRVLTPNLRVARLGPILSTSSEMANQKMANQPTKYLEHLTSLTIESEVDLHGLFSKLSFTEDPVTKKRPGLCSLALILKPSNSDSVVLDSKLNIPWTELRRLEIHYHAPNECDMSSILANCTQLKYLSLISSTQNPTLTLESDVTCPITDLDLGDGLPCEPILSKLQTVTTVTTAKFDRLYPSSLGEAVNIDAATRLANKLALQRGLAHLVVNEAVRPSLFRRILISLKLSLNTGTFKIVGCDEEWPDETINMSRLQRVSASCESGDIEIFKSRLIFNLTIKDGLQYDVAVHGNELRLQCIQ